VLAALDKGVNDTWSCSSQCDTWSCRRGSTGMWAVCCIDWLSTWYLFAGWREEARKCLTQNCPPTWSQYEFARWLIAATYSSYLLPVDLLSSMLQLLVKQSARREAEARSHYELLAQVGPSHSMPFCLALLRPALLRF
jgi:hypothetical protein